VQGYIIKPQLTVFAEDVGNIHTSNARANVHLVDLENQNNCENIIGILRQRLLMVIKHEIIERFMLVG
jgi:hypothetical protein